MAYRIVFSNIKGGTGKSTLMYQIGSCLSDRGYKVLFVETDAQHNLSDSIFNKVPDIGLFDLMTDKVTINDVVYTPYDGIDRLKNIDIIPCDYNLFNYVKGSPLELTERLKLIEPFYDIIMLDTNPSLSAILTNALVYSDKIIGVLDSSISSVRGLEFLKDTVIREIQEKVKPNVEFLGVILNNNNRNTQFSDELLKLCERNYGNLMFKTIVAHSVIYKESNAARIPLIEYCPRHQATMQINDLTIEIIKRLESGVNG